MNYQSGVVSLVRKKRNRSRNDRQTTIEKEKEKEKTKRAASTVRSNVAVERVIKNTTVRARVQCIVYRYRTKLPNNRK